MDEVLPICIVLLVLFSPNDTGMQCNTFLKSNIILNKIIVVIMIIAVIDYII